MMQASTKLKRIYRHKAVSNLTLKDIERLIEQEDISYSGDYGLKAYDKDVRLVFSLN